MATVKNITLVRGDTHTFNLTVKTKSTGLARDITGWTFYLTIKANITDLDADALLQKTITTLTDPTNGKTAITILPADTFDLTPGEYFYDIQALTNVANDVHTLIKGRLLLDWDATRVYGTAGTGA